MTIEILDSVMAGPKELCHTVDRAARQYDEERIPTPVSGDIISDFFSQRSSNKT